MVLRGIYVWGVGGEAHDCGKWGYGCEVPELRLRQTIKLSAIKLLAIQLLQFFVTVI